MKHAIRLVLAGWFVGVILLALWSGPAHGQTPATYDKAFPLVAHLTPFLGDPPLSGYLGLVVAGEGRAAELYMVRAEGGEPLRLTDNAVADGSPSWSPDNRWIAFARETVDGNDIWQAMMMEADGADVRPLAPELTGTAHRFHWSPDGRYVLGEVRLPGQSAGLRRLVVASDAGTTVAQVEDAFTGGFGWELGWSPNSRYFHFKDLEGVHLFSLEEQRIVLTYPDPIDDLLWRPDSSAILVVRTGPYRYGRLVPVDGSPPRDLFTGNFIVTGWLTGGDSALLFNWSDGYLYRVFLSGGEPIPVSEGSSWFGGISEDGDTIFYLETGVGMVVHPIDGVPREVTEIECDPDPTIWCRPGVVDWAPDESRVLFAVDQSGYRYGSSTLHVAETDGYSPTSPRLGRSGGTSNLRFLPYSSRFAAATINTGYPAYEQYDILSDAVEAHTIEVVYPEAWAGLVEWRYVP